MYIDRTDIGWHLRRIGTLALSFPLPPRIPAGVRDGYIRELPYFNKNETEVKEKEEKKNNCLYSGSKRDSNPVSAVVISFLNRRHIPLYKQNLLEDLRAGEDGKRTHVYVRSLVTHPVLAAS
jgi:hypothetical protein